MNQYGFQLQLLLNQMQGFHFLSLQLVKEFSKTVGIITKWIQLASHWWETLRQSQNKLHEGREQMETSNSQNHKSPSSVAFAYWGKTTLPEGSLDPSYFFLMCLQIMFRYRVYSPLQLPPFQRKNRRIKRRMRVRKEIKGFGVYQFTLFALLIFKWLCG